MVNDGFDANHLVGQMMLFDVIFVVGSVERHVGASLLDAAKRVVAGKTSTRFVLN